MNDKKDKIVNVSVEDILPNRFQPRLAFDEKELNSLSESIAKYGIIQPIVLRQIGDKYEIIAGERRYKATVLAGLKTIPAIINNTDDNTSAEIALLENLQRKDLTVIEEAQSFKKLIDRGFTQEEISSKLGVSQSSIANKIRLLNLPKQVQDALLYSKISERHARSLLSLNDSEKQVELLDRIVKEKLTVRQTEDEIAKLLNKNIVEDDIPEGIRKFIENNEISTINEPKFIEKLDTEVSQEEDRKQELNPFQTKFEDNLKKIEEEIKNQNDSYYDKIINNDLRNKSLDIVDLGNHMEEINEDNPVEELDLNPNRENKNLDKIVFEIKDFINSINSASVKTREHDLPEKYQIIIDIYKNV